MQAPDRQLWDEAVAGSRVAFGQLFDRHVKAVYNHCFRLSGSWTVAEDATQRTFLVAWRKREQVRLETDFVLPWLLAIASNATRDERRSTRRWAAALFRAGVSRDDVADVADEVTARVDDERRMQAVLRAVRRLSRAEREALALCVWSSVSYAEAAVLLGITESSVRARVSRARARLARIFDRPGEVQVDETVSRRSNA
jgi:RNA polymerase sigma-70 factor (ECF subfamily)